MAAETAQSTIPSLSSNGIWSIEKFETVAELSARAVGSYLDSLPADKRGYAIDEIEAQIESRRESPADDRE